MARVGDGGTLGFTPPKSVRPTRWAPSAVVPAAIAMTSQGAARGRFERRWSRSG